jgi:hypothetical protein
MSDEPESGFIVKADLGGGLFAWIKRRSGPYRIGPREHATVFADRIAAQESITQLPEEVRGSAKFSIQNANDSARTPVQKPGVITRPPSLCRRAFCCAERFRCSKPLVDGKPS